MPGSHSTRPGDIVKALNGKVVEINNTDAEGRLILGDAMTYAERLGATHMVDVATLTGAVGRALGELVTGAFGTPQDWVERSQAAADQAGERLWQIPLVDEYVPTWTAGTPTSRTPASSRAGSSRAALFLREFVDQPVGPPRHRRHRLLPQGQAVRAARVATGVTHATLVELALAGATAQA